MSRGEAISIRNELEDIEASDGKAGFSNKELKEARDLLVSEGLISDPSIVTKGNLWRFLVKLRQVISDMSADSKSNCRPVDSIVGPTTICDTTTYSVVFYLTNGLPKITQKESHENGKADKDKWIDFKWFF